jgi:DNA-binding NarL/FixJ family response regulator
MRPSSRSEEAVTDLRPLRLLIVDDHEVVREGLMAALSKDSRFSLVGGASTAQEAVDLARRERPDVAIVDMHLPDVPGHELCRQLRGLIRDITVIALSSYLTEEAVRNAIRAGASAYVTKAAGLQELRAVLDEVCAPGGSRPADALNVTQIVRRLEQLVEARSDTSTPTPQQARVLQLAAQGLTYGEIAKRLMISESTVRFHIQKLKLKFETNSKTELVARAIRSGLIVAADDESIS